MNACISQPQPTVAVMALKSNVTLSRFLTSIRKPLPAEKPAVQWPPERTVNDTNASSANFLTIV